MSPTQLSDGNLSIYIVFAFVSTMHNPKPTIIPYRWIRVDDDEVLLCHDGTEMQHLNAFGKFINPNNGLAFNNS